jgi:hypothetical protein
MKAHSTVFAFDNYFGDSPMAADPAAQTALLKSLGYSATYHSMNRKQEEGWNMFLAWDESSRQGGLPVIAYYTMLELGEEPPEGGHSVEEVIAHLPYRARCWNWPSRCPGRKLRMPRAMRR